METLLHTVQLYGAAGIAAFGWAMCALLGWHSARWMPLWFCAALLIYNLDRLRGDPADLTNTPLRAAASLRLRPASILVAVGAALVLLIWPLVRRDWLTFALALGGGAFCANYSVPLFGFRFKDVPLVKTFFAPTIVTAAIFGLPLLHGEISRHAFLAAAWAWCFLEFNMLVCDLRDIEGDRQCGVQSVPSVLGVARTKRLLRAIVCACTALAAANASLSRGAEWLAITLLGAAYLGALTFAWRKGRPERFYEWGVEGMLFLPTLAIVLLSY